MGLFSKSRDMGLSVYLITKNEGTHLSQVLASCDGADEIVVVDSGSTDRTLEIARAAGARVIHQDWLGFARQKDFALRQCQHEWVLNMDGDEILSAGAMPLIRQAIESGRAVGYRISRDDEFMGESMAVSHCRPFLRVYRRDQAAWDLNKTVHEHIEVPGPHPTIRGVIIHHKGYDSVSVYMDKLNRYAALKNVMWERARPQEVSAEQVAGQAAEQRSWAIQEGVRASFFLAQLPNGIRLHVREEPGGPPAFDPAVFLRIADKDGLADDDVGRAGFEHIDQVQQLGAGDRVAGGADVDVLPFGRGDALVPGFIEAAWPTDEAQPRMPKVFREVFERPVPGEAVHYDNLIREFLPKADVRQARLDQLKAVVDGHDYAESQAQRASPEGID